ncbi:hypothetical protein RND71_030849 [Anisodus tanguticus]|uniref:Uncharacterized protein n=1 Tax=Anisodus tanguticus TaxID=243964 RepID=A0AAE1V5V6_9SOLA|nr:hypothetical protein RND71_030849 [Anisodus tanguticus]
MGEIINDPIEKDITNWIRNIEQRASDNVNKILVGDKADMDESKRVASRAHNTSTPYPELVTTRTTPIIAYTNSNNRTRDFVP